MTVRLLQHQFHFALLRLFNNDDFNYSHYLSNRARIMEHTHGMRLNLKDMEFPKKRLLHIEVLG